MYIYLYVYIFIYIYVYVFIHMYVYKRSNPEQVDGQKVFAADTEGMKKLQAMILGEIGTFVTLKFSREEDDGEVYEYTVPPPSPPTPPPHLPPTPCAQPPPRSVDGGEM